MAAVYAVFALRRAPEIVSAVGYVRYPLAKISYNRRVRLNPMSGHRQAIHWRGK
jgi:hypothetical protein